jgi:hypothetical protein
MLRASRSSVAASIMRDEVSSVKKDNEVVIRDQPRSMAPPAGSLPKLNPKRRTRQPSGDIKWS